MANLIVKSNKKRDNRNTPKKSWEDILKFVNKDTKLWLPFFNDGACKTILNNLGYNNVIHKNEDFFTYDISDALIIDNPPWSIKEKIINKLYGTRSFVLLLPLDTLERKYMKKFLKGFQIVIPSYRYNYIEGKSAVPFKSCWFCWNMQDYLGTDKLMIWL